MADEDRSEPRCSQCGDIVTPGKDALGNAKNGYDCAACIYSEFGYFPAGMTPEHFEEDEDPDCCDTR